MKSIIITISAAVIFLTIIAIGSFNFLSNYLMLREEDAIKHTIFLPKGYCGSFAIFWMDGHGEAALDQSQKLETFVPEGVAYVVLNRNYPSHKVQFVIRELGLESNMAISREGAGIRSVNKRTVGMPIVPLNEKDGFYEIPYFSIDVEGESNCMDLFDYRGEGDLARSVLFEE